MTIPRRALVVIDVQQDYFTGPVSIQYPPLDESLPNILEALAAATANNLPVAIIQHSEVPGAPIFAPGTDGWELHPAIAAALEPSWKRIEKHQPSSFVGTDLEQWLRDHDADTITIVGYMTNNCNQATANHAVTLGLNAEVLSDASGAIALDNEAGSVTARQLHEAELVLLQSNFAAVATTEDWISAVQSQQELTRNNPLVSTLRARGQWPPAD